MRIAVIGLWHLGTVTAACLASVGHTVTAIDPDANVVAGLLAGELPVQEPGLAPLIEAQVRSGNLRFSSQLEAVGGNEVAWLAFDTPVDEHDVADVDSVIDKAIALLPFMATGAIMLVSSQMPVGSVARLEKHHKELALKNRVRFACAPENLRLGKAIEVFLEPDRVVVGVRLREDRDLLESIWSPFTAQIEWMSVESAEMTKHAINAFLATSVAFANEIARICERVGADAIEVERGLKSDLRIGRRAYLHPGAAYGGGTLARDITFLQDVASSNGVEPALFKGVKTSNDLHQNWLYDHFLRCVGRPRGKTVAVLGLTYKAGTSALRRSKALETCSWLCGEGASVMAYDPTVQVRQPEIPPAVHLAATLEEALDQADVLLVATEWPQFQALLPETLVQRMKSALVIDPSGHLERTLGHDGRIRYHSVGRNR
jgi:UDPglucose 6-dehydrogenase